MTTSIFFKNKNLIEKNDGLALLSISSIGLGIILSLYFSLQVHAADAKTTTTANALNRAALEAAYTNNTSSNPSPDAQKFSLRQIMQHAELFDTTLKIAKTQHQANLSRSMQSFAGILPSVNAYANAQELYSKPGQGNTFTGYTYGVGVSANQPLYRVDKALNIQQARISEDVSTWNVELQTYDLWLRCMQAYVALLQSKEDVRILAQKKRSIEEQLKQAQRNFDVGVATITDVYEAKARLDALVAQNIHLDYTIQSQKQKLNELTGLAVDDIQDIEINIPALQAALVLELQTHRHPGVKMAIANVALAKKEYEKAKKLSYPTLDLVASAQQNKTAQNFSSGRNASIGLQFNMPLFTETSRGYKEEEMAALQEKAQQDLLGYSQKLQTDFFENVQKIKSLVAQRQALESARISAQKLLEATKTAYSVGIRINLDVLNAQDQVWEAEKNIKKNTYELFAQALQLQMQQAGLSMNSWQDLTKN